MLKLIIEPLITIFVIIRPNSYGGITEGSREIG